MYRDQPRLGFDQCRDLIESTAFRLQPKDYGRDFPKWPGLVGIEVEMLPLTNVDADTPSTVPIYEGNPNLSEPLIDIAAETSGWSCQVVPDTEPSQLFRVHLEEGDQLSFEPGGQLEISTVPYPCLSDASRRVVSLQEKLKAGLAQKQIEIVQVGINPWHTPDQIGLQMHKKRYKAMTDHFTSISPYGVRMMRQTCTVQVNLDFGCSDDALARRFAASQLIAPFATAIFANSPIVDGKSTEYKSFRSRIWQMLDGSRTGFPDLKKLFKEMNRKSAVDSYVEKTLNALVIFKASENYERPGTGYTLTDWCNESDPQRRPTAEDIKVHLSLMFPEVRARGFLELRSVDCQSRVWQFIPAAFWTGILYDDHTLERVLDILLPHHEKLYSFWLESSYGLREDSLFSDLALQVYEMSMEGFQSLPECFRKHCAIRQVEKFSSRFTRMKRSPADDLLASYHRDGKLTLAGLKKLDDAWEKEVDCV